MTMMEFGGLSIAYFISLILILALTYRAYREFRRVRFNFNIFFSLLYLLTFYFGFPLTGLLVFQFDVNVVSTNALFNALLSSISFYIVYYIAYKTRLRTGVQQSEQSLFTMNGVETRLTCLLLMLIAIVTVAIFFLQNGFLLFRLQSYRQIFSSEVSSVALKRFFYFFHSGNVNCLFFKADPVSLVIFSL
ncbi:Putative ECA polymerase [Arsenophonus endosymbiont of Bemisia tabaci Q2]|nr:Putative ECA polymerase [Arsenophonus endosymbiont of Bemisia tabaci Q2]